MFKSVVAVVFQSVFHVEIYQNDVFLFFKKYFWDQSIKKIQNTQKKLIFNKKTFLKFLENVIYTEFLNALVLLFHTPKPIV
jgi:hypothetical protein